MGVRGSRLTCQGKRDRGTLDWGIQQWVVHRQGEPNGGVRGSIWLGSGWKSNPRSRCSVDGGGVDLGSSSGSGADFRAGLPAGHRIGSGVDEGGLEGSHQLRHQSQVHAVWLLGVGGKIQGPFQGRCRVVQGLLKAPFTTITHRYNTQVNVSRYFQGGYPGYILVGYP